MKIFKNKKGESIIEVIVAALVLTMASTAAAVLLSSAFASNALTRDRMRATNLAREGIEALINIRDTNVLRSGAFKEFCWNFREVKGGNNICNDSVAASRLIQPKKHRLILTDDYKWYLEENSSSDLNSAFLVPPLDPSATVDPVEFYRTIEIKYYKLDANGAPDFVNALSDPKTATIMEAKSTVRWIFKGETKAVSLKTLLTKHN